MTQRISESYENVCISNLEPVLPCGVVRYDSAASRGGSVYTVHSGKLNNGECRGTVEVGKCL
jgi:hypothetical protein